MRTDDPELLDAIRARVPAGARECRSPAVDQLFSIVSGRTKSASPIRRYYLVYSGAALHARTLDRDEALERFESVIRLEMAVSARRWTIVHAGVVEWHGRAIVIAGSSMSGKSTLVQALVAQGARYYSDEFAPIDSRGRVHPYRKPLSLRQADGTTRLVSPAPLASAPPLRPGLIVLTSHAPGHTWNPRVITAGQAVLQLLGHTVRARIDPPGTLRTLAALAQGAVTLEGTRGEAVETAAAILAHSALAGHPNIPPAGRLADFFTSLYA